MARVITAPGIVRNVSKYLNSMRRVPFAIGKDDWTEVDSSTYTYEFVTAYVTTSSFDIGTFDNSVRSYAKGDINMEKKNGGGGMVFTTTKRPTGTVSGSIYIWDNNDNKVPVILEDTVVPIENGGTGATSVPGILSNLGLGSANDAQETLEFGDAVHEDVANNVTTTSEGYLLDARQGKVLKDSVDGLDSDIKRTVLTTATNFNTLRVTGNGQNQYYCGDNLAIHSNIPTDISGNTPFTLDVVSMGSYSVQILKTYASTGGPKEYKRQTYYSSGSTPYNTWTSLDSKVSEIGTVINGTGSVSSIQNETYTTVLSATITPGTWIIVRGSDFSINNNGIRRVGANDSSSRIAYVNQNAVPGTDTCLQHIELKQVNSNTTINCVLYQNSGNAMNIWPYMFAIKIK